LATYAYCRIADDIVDTAQGDRDGASTKLGDWESEIELPRHPVAIAFADARAQFSVPEAPVRDLLAGIRMDLRPQRYATWPELRVYCHHVAGTVGLMMAPILGCCDPEEFDHAATLGIAMQLTNIVRDVAEDARNGRLYLPLDEVYAFGCDPEAIIAGSPGRQFRDLIAHQVARARSLYAAATPGMGALAPSGQLTTLAASRLYARILDEVESRGYDVLERRARVSSRQKAIALPGIAAAFAKLRLTTLRDAPAESAPRAGGSLHPTMISAADHCARVNVSAMTQMDRRSCG
jgi:phytoene synthase